jgi:hypothetical protein
MPPIYDAGRIKGTDPRVRPVTDRIGRGYQQSPRERIAADNAIERAGGRASDMDVNDDFAKRLGMAAPEPESSAHARYKANLPQQRPTGRRKFVHETDLANLESIRKGGIRPTRGGSAMGSEGVYAYEREGPAHRVPEGRVAIEFEADAGRIRGGGTTPGATSRVLQGGIDPGDITGGWGPKGRIFDAGTSAGLLGLLGQAAQFIPGFAERMPRTNWLASGGPIGEAMNYAIQQNYAPGGVMDPYKDVRDLPGFNPQTGTVMA